VLDAGQFRSLLVSYLSGVRWPAIDMFSGKSLLPLDFSTQECTEGKLH
jgi:hypothetical protein